MSKKLIDVSGEQLTSTKSVLSVKPVGTQVLLELLSAKEALGTKFHVSESAAVGAPQGFIVGLGPKVSAEEWGFKVGDRVVLSGGYTPIPDTVKSKTTDRMLGCVEPHCIKAVLIEG